MDTHSSDTPATEQGPADWSKEVASDALFTEGVKVRLGRPGVELAQRLRDEAGEWGKDEPLRKLLTEAAEWIDRRA